MTFHEKSAWIMGILLALAGGWYVKNVWSASQSIGETIPPSIGLISVVTIILVVGTIVTHTVVAAVDPENADDTEDERDKQVLRRSGNIAGYVLGFGCFGGLWHFYWLNDGNMLFHIIVASLIAGQIAEYVLTILFYRRSV